MSREKFYRTPFRYGTYETHTHVTPTMEHVEQTGFVEGCRYEDEKMPDLENVRKTTKKTAIRKKDAKEILRLSGILTPTTLHAG